MTHKYNIEKKWKLRIKMNDCVQYDAMKKSLEKLWPGEEDGWALVPHPNLFQALIYLLLCLPCLYSKIHNQSLTIVKGTELQTETRRVLQRGDPIQTFKEVLRDLAYLSASNY